jgi:hypothetical protein
MCPAGILHARGGASVDLLALNDRAARRTVEQSEEGSGYPKGQHHLQKRHIKTVLITKQTRSNCQR